MEHDLTILYLLWTHHYWGSQNKVCLKIKNKMTYSLWRLQYNSIWHYNLETEFLFIWFSFLKIFKQGLKQQFTNVENRYKILFRGKKISSKFCYLSGCLIFNKSVICLFPISFYLTRLPNRAKLVMERLERMFPVYVPFNEKCFSDVRWLGLFHQYVCVYVHEQLFW